jgi:polyhydroxyalkanoate synthesis repressor PhaR
VGTTAGLWAYSAAGLARSALLDAEARRMVRGAGQLQELSVPKSIAPKTRAAAAKKGTSTRSAGRAQPASPSSRADLTEPVQEGSVRVIKKYPNRRLYDTETSSYITLAAVRQLVMDSASFVVRDAKTNEDLTRSILLQIILEEESGGAPMFTEPVLGNIIRFYGNAMQSFMGSYLEKNMQGFIDLQLNMAEKTKGMSPEMWTQFMSAQSPMMKGMMGTYVEQSKTVFTQMQEQMQKQSEQMLAALGLKPPRR